MGVTKSTREEGRWGWGCGMHAQNLQGPDPGEEHAGLGSAREERPRKGMCAGPQ